MSGFANAQEPSAAGLLECLEQEAVSTAKTPFDLWRRIPTCVAEGKHDQAAFMYGLAGSLAIFDSMRVKDRSAHQAAKVLPMGGQAAMGKERSELFQQKVRERFGDGAKRAKLCEAYKGMPPPAYFPSYMIDHGLANLSGSTADPLVSGFNESENWPKAVDAYMLCSSNPPSPAQSDGERLFVDIPEYWGMSQPIQETSLGRGVMVKGKIPASQSKRVFEEAIWENTFPNLPRPMPIAQFADEMLKQYWIQCETLRTTKPLLGKERGYEVAYVQATCNRVKAEPYKAIFVRAKYMKSGANYYAVAHEFAFQSFDAVGGGESSVLTESVFGGKEKAERFARFMEASAKLLEERAYLCRRGEASCQ
jgi:hypothetical protein